MHCHNLISQTRKDLRFNCSVSDMSSNLKHVTEVITKQIFNTRLTDVFPQTVQDLCRLEVIHRFNTYSQN
ncbi:hypothetical protein BDA96_01G265700 [Sorghum bicolor]|uniref:Uncharacterized protein n=2 Tax=Sorghum bicolor TaxID=4558 RepID=A0A921S0W9_SORBI|nr:hypothetical protein BDA96_01G265700 [Sorghum bicolor]KXG38546.2 hypothetical protein SORBI_3001G250750 [Sorghum bicolor]